MTVLERIKTLCRQKKNISITTLEQILGYSNGSLAKVKDIPGSRIAEIAIFLGTTTDYLLIGKEFGLMGDIANSDAELTELDEEIKQYAIKISKMNDKDKNYIFQTIDMVTNIMNKE